MKSFKRSLAVFVSSFALLLGILVPVAASADTLYAPGYYQYQYGYNNNCGWNNNYGYSYGYWNCNNSTQGSVTVYVTVNNQYQYGQYKSPSDFTFYVAGANSNQQYFQGSSNGTTVWVNGSYSVSVYNQTGYTPSYSGSCSGTVANGSNAACYITLTPTYAYGSGYYNYPYGYQYPSYSYTQPAQPVQTSVAAVTVVSKYVPSLPNTGFEPISAYALPLALALVLLVVAGVVLQPYVRKAVATLIR
ncbi:MAG TPA: hypothetical protein VG934_00580 [Candidatus Paceibacterota bacterium]|nr:hypothetical protein [Candidatus Paceibacterota bacterium]